MNLSVCVIGTIFIDCKGFSQHKYNPSGRNLGHISFVHGGVGRNVAENLANLGLPVTFISSVDKTGIGREVIERLNSRHINTTYLLEAEKNGMGMWLAILDENGDLAGSISKMPDLALLEELISSKCYHIIENSSHIVLELDLNKKITLNVINMANKMRKPVYGLPGNLDVILNNLQILQALECFICNDFEAGKIMGVDFTGATIEQIKACIKESALIGKTGLRYLVVTLGDRGCIYSDSLNRIVEHQPAIPTRVVDTTGAGDAFFSGTVMGLIKNLPLSEAVVYGTKIASWTIQSPESICLDLLSRIKEDGLISK